MDDYRVELPSFTGPLDLLLYLVKKLEVDIYDIPVGQMTEQYLAHLELLQELDVELAGDFLVMASTLMEIKSRMLLPREVVEADDQAEDPRQDLVKELLEYKRYKEAAGVLEQRAGWDEVRFARETPARVERSDPFAEVDVWDLVTAFSRIIAATGGAVTPSIKLDDRPVQFYMERIEQALGGSRSLPLSRLFTGSRHEMVGTFLALLELIRLRRVRASQEQNFDEIHVFAAEPEEEQEGSNRQGTEFAKDTLEDEQVDVE